MAAAGPRGRVTTRRCDLGLLDRGGKLVVEDLGGFTDLEGGEDLALALGRRRALGDAALPRLQRDECHPIELVAEVAPGVAGRVLGDLNTLGYLFESLAARDIRVYAAAADATVHHYRERAGELEGDLVVERRGGAWIGAEVKLGSTHVDDAATALLRLAPARTTRLPAALTVLTATGHAYQRPDGVAVVPLGLLGP